MFLICKSGLFVACRTRLSVPSSRVAQLCFAFFPHRHEHGYTGMQGSTKIILCGEAGLRCPVQYSWTTKNGTIGWIYYYYLPMRSGFPWHDWLYWTCITLGSRTFFPRIQGTGVRLESVGWPELISAADVVKRSCRLGSSYTSYRLLVWSFND